MRRFVWFLILAGAATGGWYWWSTRPAPPTEQARNARPNLIPVVAASAALPVSTDSGSEPAPSSACACWCVRFVIGVVPAIVPFVHAKHTTPTCTSSRFA